jgi:hypothetical protein
MAKDHGSNFKATSNKSVEENAYTIGTQAYIWGISPYISYYTRFIEIYTDKKDITPRGFFETRGLGNFRNTPWKMPSNNTIYGSAWVFVGDEPLILSIPNMEEALYYSVALVDFYQNTFHVFGRRTIGSEGGNFAITDPKWNGDLPSCLKGRVEAPTPWLWLLQRIAPQTIKDEDVECVKQLQNKIQLTPLSQWGNPNFKPPVKYRDSIGMVNPDFKDDPLHFFEVLSEIINQNPPPSDPESTGLMSLLSQIDLGPDMKFDRKKLDPEVKKGLIRAVNNGDNIITASTYKRRKINGWVVPPKEMGNYGSNYLYRAVYSIKIPGALPRSEIIYVTAFEDGEGNPLHGSSRYTLNIPKNVYSQQDALWSLTAYDSRMMLVSNPLNRYQVGSQVPDLNYAKDGSLEVTLQNRYPGSKKLNWLPVPEDSFSLTFRWYLPKKPVLGIYSAKFKLPPVQKVD